MFPPDADESPYRTKPPAAAAKDAKPPPPKIIKYGNTRLLEQDDTPSASISAPPSPTRSRIDAAIMGTPCALLSVTPVFVLATDMNWLQTGPNHQR